MEISSISFTPKDFIETNNLVSRINFFDVFNRLHDAGAGAVVTKSLSKEPWEGYPNPTIFSVKGGGWINAVGLSNPGAETFAKMIEPNDDVPIVVSLVGSVEDDFEYMIKKFENA